MPNLNEVPLALTFADVQLVPCHSTVKSRKEPDVSTTVGMDKLSVPVVASPMNSVCEEQMSWLLNAEGGTSVIHRYMTVQKQIEKVKSLKYCENNAIHFYVAVGATGDFLERVAALREVGQKHFCIDVANGHSLVVLEATRKIKKAFSDVVLMTGNVCSYQGASDLAHNGIDVIRVGIGNGSRCITRLVTGFGVPQMTALEDCWRIKQDYPNVSLISDGGIKNSGDAVKALVFSDAIMVGNLLAGTDESPGAIHKDAVSGQMFKDYAGMASAEARSEWFDGAATSFVPEGVSIRVPYKGDASTVIQKMVSGIKVGMSYCGAKTLAELRQNARFVRVTNAGWAEGLPTT